MASSGQGTSSLQFTVAANPNPVARQGNLKVNDSELRISQSPMACTFDVTPRSITLTSGGGSATITVTANGNCGWASTGAPSWLNVTAPSNANGNGSISVSAPANAGPVRIGSVTVAGVTVIVSQEATAAPNCQATIQPSSLTVSSAGGTSPPVAVQVAAGCSWTAQSSVPWVTIASGGGGNASGSVSLSVAANTGAERAGVVSIAGQVLTVTQSAASCSFDVSPTSLSAAAAGVTLPAVSVTTGPACTWSSTSSAQWLSFTASPPMTGNGTRQIVAAANPGGARSGTVTIAGITITVNQDALACSYSLAPGSQSIAAAGGTGNSFSVTTSGACGWTASTTDGWITITQGGSGSGNGTVTFSVAANTGAARSGTISVQGQTFTVNQAAQTVVTPQCTYQISPGTFAATAAGGAGPDIAVTSGSACSWAATTADTWITITSGATGTANGTVRFSIAANTGAARSGTISVQGQSFTVNQAAQTVVTPPPACTYQISPSTFAATAAGGAGPDIAVTAGSGCNWTATTTDSWISITSGATGTANGTVRFSAAANTGAARTGTINVQGQTFTVSQAAQVTPPPVCTYQISPNTFAATAAGGAGPAIAVTSGNGCNWTATTTDTWITITSGATGTANGTVRFSAAANTGAARTGTINVQGQIFTINQAAAPAPPVCTYQIAPSTYTASAAGGAGPDIAVTAGTGCDWTATTATSWITITSGATGTANGTVKFSVSANTGPSRNGSISIHGTTFSVTQVSGCTFQINPTSQSIGANGGGGRDINVTAGTGCTWTATTTDSWLTITNATPPGPVKFTIAANNGPARTGTIAIDQQSFTVTQASGCTFQLNPTSATIAGNAGAGGSVTVTTAPGCTWTASSNDSWLSIGSGASGNGSGTVTYSATTANTQGGHRTRSGSLTIANITFNVTQNNNN